LRQPFRNDLAKSAHFHVKAGKSFNIQSNLIKF
jgi:hypothetical protein